MASINVGQTESRGYLYFIIRSEDVDTPDDVTIFVKVGMTKDPCSRISNYITHHIGDSPPIYYKIWQLRNEKNEESLALAHFEKQRVIKAGSMNPSEVIRATKNEIEAYSPQDPQKKAIAPHTVLPAEHYVIKHDVSQRFEEHWEELSQIQNKVITDIVNFLSTPHDDLTASQLARKLRAPCGTGKTHMTCEAIRRVAADDTSLKVCVLCPTKLIADQWRGNFYRLGIHAPILTKADLQTKEGEQREDQTGHRLRIVTYASCPGLRADPSWTYVFDEAHHTSGLIDDDNGITKRLTNETASSGCRRLFLTFTPKTLQGEGVNSMDNVDLYGSEILFPSMRDLVNSGLMPDYKLTLTYRDHNGTLNAVMKELKHCKKILVCVQNVKDIDTTNEYLKHLNPETNVYMAHSGMQSEAVNENIANFSNQLGRSWLLTCLVLLEGADIPVADTVVLLAPWKTETRLVQLLLRPGRWYPKKPTFNIVSPSDEGNLIENNLRIAGFDVLPNKIVHMKAEDNSNGGKTSRKKRTSAEVVADSEHVWCVSYTEKNSVQEGLTPAVSDFDNAIQKSQISAMQIGLDKAKPGDLVILRGPVKVAVAVVSAVKTVLEPIGDGKDRKRTILDVNFLRIRWETKVCKAAKVLRTPKAQDSAILISVFDYRACICELWNDRDDRDWICNPRFTGGFRYDNDRRTLISRLLAPDVYE